MRMLICSLVATMVLPSTHALAADVDWKNCLSALRAGAPRRGVSRSDFDRLTQASTLQAITIEKSRKQPEFTVEWSTYLARAVTAERVEAGRTLLLTWKVTLTAVAERFQVEPATVLAIWGIESNYGASLGETPVLDAWITRSCLQPREKVWRENVYASLRLLKAGVVRRDAFTGSWSGAFGLTQFIPTSFEEFARDGDGDGRIDLYASVPDALASTASHLSRRTRWQYGVPAAIEVRLSADQLPRSAAGSGEWRDPIRRPLAEWASGGVTRVDGSALPEGPELQQMPAALFLPEGTGGRAFLVTPNFDALLAYNRSTKYALSVALIATAIAQP